MIDHLQAALAISPDNLPLRNLLAQAYVDAARWLEAEVHLNILLQIEPDNKSTKLLLAKAFYHNGKSSASSVILEELQASDFINADYQLLYAQVLLHLNMPSEAVSHYAEALALNPSVHNKVLQTLYNSLKSTEQSNNLENLSAKYAGSAVLEKPNINFQSVGGMESVKEEIRLKIIHPIAHPEIYNAYGKKSGGGILLYGPPGCGKTFIARATAGELKGTFISVGINDVLDMWLGNSEKNLHELFQLARSNKPCVLFFDEVDALGAARSNLKHTNSKNIINQFLEEMDGVKYSNEGILVLGATNTPWDMDPAFKRPGRFDKLIFVGPPDKASRESILALVLKDIPHENLDLPNLASLTDGYSGADLRSLVDTSVDLKIAESLAKGYAIKLTNADLLKVAKQQKCSTSEWMNIAKNYALYSNVSGHYDDILKFFNIKK